MNEAWVNIIDFEDYEISNLGNCRRNNKILKPTLMRVGYYSFALSKNGKVTRKYVHRLVARHFVGKISKELVVNHKDSNKLNNKLDNLEIISRIENGKHWVKSKKRSNTGRKSNGLCDRGHKLNSYGSCNVCRSKEFRKSINTKPPQNSNWKAISEDYLVSDKGQVWTNKRFKLLKPGINKPGYLYVNLKIGSKYKNYSVSRLVAENFIGPIPENKIVDHINSNKLDNRAENLRIISKSENSKHSITKLRRDDDLFQKLSKKEIENILWVLANYKLPVSRIATFFSVSQSFASALQRKKHHNNIKPIAPNEAIIKKLESYVEDYKNEIISLKKSNRSLIESEIEFIRNNIKTRQYSQKEICEMFNISSSTISKIKLRKSPYDL